MKQIFQSLKNGELIISDLPSPNVKAGHLLIQTSKTLISLGTEKMLMEFGKAGWISKARQQPEKVQQVIQKIKTDGLQPTLQSVFNKLDQPLPLGYCNSGVVLEVGAGVMGFKPGDRVISNGGHAEIVVVEKNLCAKIPDNVSDLDASFTVLAAIALQGVRIAEPTLGETVVVIGLGLIGLITVQLLRANGCKVIGFDYSAAKVELAKEFGAEAYNLAEGADPVAIALAQTQDDGVDAVIITASTKSNDPIEQAPAMCRKRGKVVLVGVIGLNLKRSDFYEKEISFQVSCSYGPGRYEDAYEEQGLDYPIGFVRWTEQRNFQAILQLLSEESLNVAKMITEVVPLANAESAYQLDNPDALGYILDYPGSVDLANKSVELNPPAGPIKAGQVGLGVIGAGNFAGATLLPAFAQTKARMVAISSAGGASSAHLGKKFKFERNSTDYKSLLEDEAINALVITTQHNSHAKMTLEGLAAGKHVFVEKPLAMNRAELQEIETLARSKPDQQLFVGFNRRYAPLIQKMKKLLKNRQAPITMMMMVNAGAIPKDHWTQDPERGGGRIIGEACHFIDLLSYLAGSPVVLVQSQQVGSSSDQICDDKATILLTFADGSIGTVHYFANGHKSLSKERIEVFSEGRVLQMDNFKSLTGLGFKGFKSEKLSNQDKGHQNQMKAFVQSIEKGTEPLISLDELINSSRATFAAVQSAQEQKAIDLTEDN